MLYSLLKFKLITKKFPIFGIFGLQYLNSGFLKPSYDADIVLIDAPLGGTQVDALAALKNGDPCAIGAVLTAGVPRFVGRSNNTPPPIREIKVLRSNVVNMFQG